MSNATIYEQGNGLPEAGDYCGGEGRLWLIESIDSRIQTGDPAGNYVYATVTEADWDDCSEGDEHTARVVVGVNVDTDTEEERRADYEMDAAKDRAILGEEG